MIHSYILNILQFPLITGEKKKYWKGARNIINILILFPDLDMEIFCKCYVESVRIINLHFFWVSESSLWKHLLLLPLLCLLSYV